MWVGYVGADRYHWNGWFTGCLYVLLYCISQLVFLRRSPIPFPSSACPTRTGTDLFELLQQITIDHPIYAISPNQHTFNVGSMIFVIFVFWALGNSGFQNLFHSWGFHRIPVVASDDIGDSTIPKTSCVYLFFPCFSEGDLDYFSIGKSTI